MPNVLTPVRQPIIRTPVRLPGAFDFNQEVLVSDPAYLEPKGINAFENPHDQPDANATKTEHQAAIRAFKEAGINVKQVPSPADCQDGVFTANWGLTWEGRALLSRLPNLRQGEEPYAEACLKRLGFETKRAQHLFSGQGDAMIIGGNRVLIGSGYRSHSGVADEIRDWLGLEPIVVRAKPKRKWFGCGPPVRNTVTGLWDSYYYDLDLAVGVVTPDLLAVCFDALTPEGQAAIHELRGVTIIPVTEHEARDGLACNLVGIDGTVIMSNEAPGLKAELEHRGFQVIALPNRELRKSGGGFRCISLSLYD